MFFKSGKRRRDAIDKQLTDIALILRGMQRAPDITKLIENELLHRYSITSTQLTYARMRIQELEKQVISLGGFPTGDTAKDFLIRAGLDK